MNILTHLSNQLVTEAVCQLLRTLEGVTVVTKGKPSTNGFTPDVLLVDVATLGQELLAAYPGAKVLLMDTGLEKPELYTTLLSYRIHGVLSPGTEPRLLKKALTAVSEGQIWIDHGSVKGLLHEGGAILSAGGTGHISSREKEIVDSVCQGLSNKEIAQRFGLSPHTIKAHLNRVFRKLNVKSRSQLLSQAMRGGRSCLTA